MRGKIWFILLVLFILPIMVFAEECPTNGISIKSIEVSDVNGEAEEKTQATIDSDKINLNLKLSEVGDYMQYRITVKNMTDQEYELSSSEIGGNSEYVNYEFVNIGDSTVIKAGETKTVQLRVSYNKEVDESNFKDGKYSDSKELVLNMSDATEDYNPITGYSAVIISMLILLGSSIMSIIALKSVKITPAFMLFFLLGLVPTTTFALCKYDIKVVSNVEIEKPKPSSPIVPEDPIPDDPTPDDPPVVDNYRYVYTYNNKQNPCQIGMPIPQNVPVVDTARATNSQIFLRHKIVDGTIVESSACVLLNDNVVCLIGTGATYSNYDYYNNDSIYYGQNRDTMISTFGSDYCGCDDYECRCAIDYENDSIGARAFSDGLVSSDDGFGCRGAECSVFPNGLSYCQRKPC